MGRVGGNVIRGTFLWGGTDSGLLSHEYRGGRKQLQSLFKNNLRRTDMTSCRDAKVLLKIYRDDYTVHTNHIGLSFLTQ